VLETFWLFEPFYKSIFFDECVANGEKENWQIKVLAMLTS